MDQFLEELKQVLGYLDDRIMKLEHTLNDVIISSWKEAAEEEAQAEAAKAAAEARKVALDAFMEKYPQVSELSGPLKALYGDDYDVYGDLFDTMQRHTGEEGFDEAAYVDGQLNDVRGRLGKVAGGDYAVEEVAAPEVVDEEQLAKELAAVS